MTKLDHDLAALRRAIPDVQIGPDRDRFIVPDQRLPAGLYSQPTTRLLVCIPPTYPTAPPDNFFVQWGLSLVSGAAIGNYSGPVALCGEQWGQFSHHIEPPAWRVATDPRVGDNLLTFLSGCVARLSQGA